jgi:hypothetical protein
MTAEFVTDDMIASDLRRLAQQLRDQVPDVTRRVVIEELERIARILEPAASPVTKQSEA